ncbi:hypothetical protein FHY12_002206 [Xanthomonas arboricola]|nr:hypothetical protein [Xanthomonas euroxanthea]
MLGLLGALKLKDPKTQIAFVLSLSDCNVRMDHLQMQSR